MFYFHYINAIGGVEQFFYEIAKKYYLSRAHQKEASELLYKLDFTQTTEAYYLYGANWNDYTDQIWSNGFNFRDYGVSLANYLGL